MDRETDIRVEERDGRGRYAMAMPDGDEAYITYARRDAGTIVVDYSFVPPRFRGRGVAAMLILRAVEDARENRVRIIPTCGYVAAEFRRHKAWHDVLGV